MKLQWFPGHMHKAQKAIREQISQIDLMIEIVDARIPASSENPMIEEIRGARPVFKIMSKSDLADPAFTAMWQAHWREQRGIDSITISPSELHKHHKIKQYAVETFATKIARKETVNALVVGIPNVGKSTLINTITGRKIARTGNEPAVTTTQQRIDLGDGVVLIDTPGMLWPNIDNPASGYRLGITGGIKDTVLDYAVLAEELLDFLIQYYPDLLCAHFGLARTDLPPAEHDVFPLIEQIAKKRGAIMSGGRVNMDRIAKLIIHDYRSGQMGRISLETPSMIAAERERVRLEQEAKARRKAERKAAFKQKSKRG